MTIEIDPALLEDIEVLLRIFEINIEQRLTTFKSRYGSEHDEGKRLLIEVHRTRLHIREMLTHAR